MRTAVHIVNTASRQGLVPVPILGAYLPAKAAVIALSEMLHVERAEHEAPVGVTVGASRPDGRRRRPDRHGALRVNALRALKPHELVLPVQPRSAGDCFSLFS